MPAEYWSRAVYCDSDGTITSTDTFVEIMRRFAPQLTERILPELYAKRLTLREGIRGFLELIPVRDYPRVVAHTDESPLRPGLGEFLDFLARHNIPCYVISGGLSDTIARKLSRETFNGKCLSDRVASITAIEVETKGEILRVPPQKFESETELVAKAKVLDYYPARERVAIGDSLTDINMALAADLVFARDRLIPYLEAENKPFIPWQNFFDIRDRLQERWGFNEQ